ncbi:hypothetical protein SDC9_119071 [bioreactor metagenome]|uniref:Uncharacterized protein n=1 Tax=bioreactor metagenome TaxID=1076179 RepID=A0A645C3Z9_9ZZZZ
MRAAAGATRKRGGGLLLVRLHRRFVICRRLALGKGNGPGGAGGQAVAKAVTIVVAQQFCLAVHHANGTLVAGGGTSPAAVAFFLVYFNDFTNHSNAPFLTL